MVKTIEQSNRDISTLKDLLSERRTTSSSQPKNYLNTVVLKPWGYEFLLFENEFVAAWFLHINGGQATSMHCHPQKKTSLVILSGRALSYTFSQRNLLSPFEAVIVKKGVFHSTSALGTEGIDLIEVETPPNKTDLVRLQDKYGRESSGYEGLSEMINTRLEKYNFFHFDETKLIGNKVTLPKYDIELKQFGTENIPAKNLFTSPALYCNCRDSIRITDADGATNEIGTGDLITSKNINFNADLSEQKISLLKISPTAKGNS